MNKVYHRCNIYKNSSFELDKSKFDFMLISQYIIQVELIYTAKENHYINIPADNEPV